MVRLGGGRSNLTHGLVGAALGETGLKKRTGLGLATLIIAANLPDLDALGWLVGENLAWRRGWTHGPLALLLFPLLLAWAMVSFDRWQARRGKRPPDRLPVSFRWVLILGYIGIFSHVLLDVLNSYGVRWFMPFSDRWFTCNSLFIIDLWIWMALAVGFGLSWRRDRRGLPNPRRPASLALAGVSAYIAAMVAGSVAAEAIVAKEVVARGLGTPRAVMANPVPLDPFRRAIIFRVGDAYGFGELRWTPSPQLSLSPTLIPMQMDDPAVAKALAQDKGVADFMVWSQWPFADIERQGGETRVVVGDARFNIAPALGHFTVRATVRE